MFERLKKLEHILQTTPEERRREKRSEIEGGLAVVDGDAYVLKDWSASGFSIANYANRRQPGDRVDMYFSIPLSGQTLEFKCRTIISRYDADKGELGGMFANLEEELQEIMDEHFDIFTAKRYGKDFVKGLSSKISGGGE